MRLPPNVVRANSMAESCSCCCSGVRSNTKSGGSSAEPGCSTDQTEQARRHGFRSFHTGGHISTYQLPTDCFSIQPCTRCEYDFELARYGTFHHVGRNEIHTVWDVITARFVTAQTSHIGKNLFAQ